MLVVSAGLMRSGSTWQFNALRTILRRYGLKDCVGCLASDSRWTEATNRIVKIHEWNASLAEQADFVFTCHRDIRDACASLTRFHPNRVPSAFDKIMKEFGNYRKWADNAVYDMKYEQMVQDPVTCVCDTIQALGLSGLNEQTIAAEVNAIKPPRRARGHREDPDTLLWGNHITNGIPGSYEQTLDPQVILNIENEVGWWLAKKGYMANF